MAPKENTGDLVSQQLAIISDAVRRIEELITPRIPAPIPSQVVSPTPVPGIRRVPSEPPASWVPNDSLQVAIKNWQSGVMDDSTVTWVQNGMANWVDSLDFQEGKEAIGCCMAFVSYLLYQGLTIDAISEAAIPGSTPAMTYQVLSQGPQEQAWQVFSGVVRALGVRVTSSDPFSMIQSANRVRPINHV